MDDNQWTTQNFRNIKRPLTFYKRIPYSILNKTIKKQRKINQKQAKVFVFLSFLNSRTGIPPYLYRIVLLGTISFEFSWHRYTVTLPKTTSHCCSLLCWNCPTMGQTDILDNTYYHAVKTEDILKNTPDVTIHKEHEFKHILKTIITNSVFPR